MPQVLQRLVRVRLGSLCFGMIYQLPSQLVVRAAPVAKRWIGRRIGQAVDHYKERGATVDRPEDVN